MCTFGVSISDIILSRLKLKELYHIKITNFVIFDSQARVLRVLFAWSIICATKLMTWSMT